MKKIISILILLVLFFSFVSVVDATYLTLEQQLEIAKQRQRDSKRGLSREKKRTQILLGDYTNNNSHLIVVSKEINASSIELERIKSEMTDTENSVISTRKRLAEIGENIDEKRSHITGLLRFISEINNKRFIDFVFSATEFSELITRNSAINKLINAVVVKTRELKEESADQFQNQLKLEQNGIRLGELQKKQETEQKALQSLKDKYSEVSNSISREITESKQKKEQYKRDLARRDAEVERILKATEERNRRLRMEGKFIHPVPGRISSRYGMRYHPIFKTYRMHTGIDYPAKMGSPINSAADGVVAYSAWLGGYGNCVIVNHGIDSSGKAFQTLYGHMSRYGTRKGATVKKGQVIGYIGSTGWSTGPHLHFEIRVNGKHDNPEKFLP